MKSATKKVFKIIISILYIIWGITAPLTAINAIISLNVGAILAATVGVLMLLAGIFGLIGIKSLKCRIFGIVIFVVAAVSVVTSIVSGNLEWRSIVSAVLAWLFIVCV